MFKVIDRELLHGLKTYFKSVIITRLIPQTARVGDQFSGTVAESVFVYNCQTFIERHLPECHNNRGPVSINFNILCVGFVTSRRHIDPVLPRTERSGLKWRCANIAPVNEYIGTINIGHNLQHNWLRRRHRVWFRLNDWLFCRRQGLSTIRFGR